ncbi:MAG: M48 family metalloprotease [Elusimicrobia bacterium]|nr:M48 family metalloprotease [Elusimicrobiota bacterium]
MLALLYILWAVPAMAASVDDQMPLSCRTPVVTSAQANAGQRVLEPLYADTQKLLVDVQKAFYQARELARLPDARLQIFNRDDLRDCTTSAYSEMAFRGMRPYDAVLICSNFRFVVANYEQIFFVIAHELGHLKYRHAELAEDTEKLLRGRWLAAHPRNPNTPYDRKERRRQLTAAVCPQLNRQASDQEFEADRFAVDLTRRAGYDPTQGALTQRQIADYLAAAARTDVPGHDRLERARRIIERAEASLSPRLGAD